MVNKTKNQTSSVIDNSQNHQVITHSLYLVANPKTGKVEQVCRTQKGKIE